jgi:hypothetical protein
MHMKRSMRWIVASVALVGAGACAEGSPRGSQAPFVADGLPTIPDGTVDGVAVRFEPMNDYPADRPEVPGTITLTGCRLRAPGVHVFDMRWTPDAGAPRPARVLLELDRRVSDMVLAGVYGQVELSGAGSFSLAVSDLARRQPPPTAEDEVSSFAARGLGGDEVCWVSAGAHGNEMPVTVDQLPHRVTAPVDSVQALAQAADLRQADSTGVALAGLLAHRTPLLFDRLWLPDAVAIGSVSTSRRGPCRAVTSNGPAGFTNGSIAVTRITQTVGCPRPALQSNERFVTDPDGVWTVVVRVDASVTAQHPDVGTVAASTRPHPLVGASRVTKDAARFDIEAYLPVELGGRPELARFPWRDGLVAVVRDESGQSCCPFYVGIPVLPDQAGAPGGSSGTACTTHSVWMSGSDHGGYGIVVLSDPSLRAELRVPDRPPTPIELRPFADGRRIGFVDLPPSPPNHAPDFRLIPVLTTTGADAPCTQYAGDTPPGP